MKGLTKYGIGILLLTWCLMAPVQAATIQDLQVATGGQMASHLSKATGNYDFIRATGTAVLSADIISASPQTRALTFLRDYGSLIGLNDLERQAIALKLSPLPGQPIPSVSELRIIKTHKESLGKAHVRFNQFFLGLPVFGAQVVVHMDNRGINAINGNFVPALNLSIVPAVNAATAIQNALATVRKMVPDRTLTNETPSLAIYRTGLLEGFSGRNVLAYAIVVHAEPDVREQVWIDAASGTVLNIISLNPHALYRLVYTPQYNASNPDLFVVRKEGDPPSNVPPVDNLYDFTGQVYDLFASTFGRDSYDGNGTKMRTVYLVNNVCPNAYWNSSTTNYCPNFDHDDVVAHEWAHAYTEHTHGLIYSYQSGALNESYSDIFGETLDLLNNRDGIAGSNNNQVYPDGQRWLVLEDFGSGELPVLLRDMWDPERMVNPSKVSSANYYCGTEDGGGVHTNSGVPNHAYAILVDGKTFNGQTVRGIGMNKASHIYYRAMTLYQTPTTNFPQHEQALKASCQDLIGTNVNGLFTNAPSGDVITADDCAQLDKVALAVELSSEPVQCNFQPQLGQNPPAVCSGASTIFADDFESGSLSGWSLTSSGLFSGDWPNFNWDVVGSLPRGKTGRAAFAIDPKGGTCSPGGDYSGQFGMDSPPITIPAGATGVQLRFDHFIESELGFDGGNLKYSVNGGPFSVVPQGSFIYSAPKSTLKSAASDTPNTNPKAGEYAWHGADGGQTTGSWGTTIVNVSSLAAPGDTIRLRYEFGMDGCNGVTGWFVDNLSVYSCPAPPAPALAIGSGYENPDTNGAYQLTWTRPEGATGPDTLQESNSCGPLLSDNAENGFAQWNRSSGIFTWQSAMAKPLHTSNVFFAIMPEHTGNTSLTLTTKNPQSIPANGNTLLSFEDWNNNELDDRVSVQVSENGSTWTEIYSSTRADLTPLGAAFFASESLTKRTVDLAAYKGRSIYVRFNYFVGPSNFYAYSPFGWYVDNIVIESDSWKDIASISGTSYQVTGRSNGTYCYRVRTTSTINGQQVASPYSNVVSVQVGQSAQPATAPVQNAITDDTNPDQQDGIDKDGKYRLSWTYPPAPVQQPCGFRVEEASGFGTDFSDDASELLVGGSNSRWAGSTNWLSLPHLGTGTTGYSLVYTDSLDTTFTLKTPVNIPAATAAVLSFDSEEDIEETFDFGFVQISANGGAFETVAQYTGIFSGVRSIDLSSYAGQSIVVRFRVISDNAVSFPVHQGWSIDNIRIDRAINFQTIATLGSTVLQYDVTGRTNNNYAYRITGLFGNCSGSPQVGPYSDAQQIIVELGPQTADPTAEFATSPNPASTNEAVNFDASTSHDNDAIESNPQIVSYQWTFGDGGSAVSSTPGQQHTYTAAGTYRVTLVVTDNDDETASTEQLIVVNESQGTQEVTGSGHISANGDKANFSVDAQKTAGTASGSIQYHDKGSKTKVQSTGITSLTITGNRAVITGNCKIDKVSGYTFTVEVTDNGAGSNDHFSIRLSNGYQAAGQLTGGNLDVKP